MNNVQQIFSILNQILDLLRQTDLYTAPPNIPAPAPCILNPVKIAKISKLKIKIKKLQMKVKNNLRKI